MTPDGLRGRVALVDFWTYTCVNWLRTLPYVRAWVEKYADHGLTVIGVHTPEFGFEHDSDNVTAQARDLRVEYPIALDSDYGVWTAFANHFWPAVYVADAEGRIRYHHFGEGEYAMTEMVIQQLLWTQAPRASTRISSRSIRGASRSPPTGRRCAPPRPTSGMARAGASPRGLAALDEPHGYAPPRLQVNQWALSGTWTVARHAGLSHEPGGRIAFRFHARDLNLVMGPVVRGASVPFRVLLDGMPPGAAPGSTRIPTAPASFETSGPIS